MKLTKDKQTFTLGSDKADIFRDENGVVHINTTDTIALARFTGFVHAHDRQLQMMLARLISQGRLSECLKSNEETLAIDVFMREMAFSYEAEKEVRYISEAARSFNEAYCKGVNEYLRTQKGVFEFKLTGYKPEPWEIKDTLATIKLMSYIGLAQSQGEVEKFIIQCIKNQVDLEKLKSLFSPHLDALDEDTIELVKRTKLHQQTVPEHLPFLKSIPKLLASNNWSIAPSKSKTNTVLHCCDPHLEINRLPAIWCEIVGKTDSNYYMGITMPGVPGWIMGKNKDIGFGFTYGFMDMIDFFVEEIKDGKYRTEAGWVELTERTESIKRKKKDDFKFKYLETQHGVIECPPANEIVEDGLYLARAWSGHKNGAAKSLDSIYELHQADTASRAADIASKVTISCNWIMSDNKGNLVYQQSGILPDRNHSGLHPLPAWRPGAFWNGIHDPKMHSRTENPPEGFLVTANNDLNQEGKPLSINMPMGPYRSERITTLLSNTDSLDIEDMIVIQSDLYSNQAEQLLEKLAPFIQNSGNAEILNKWDRCYDKNSYGAVVFEKLYRELLIEIFGRNFIGEDLFNNLLDDTPVIVDFYHNFDKILINEEYRHSELWFNGSRDAVFKKVVDKVIDNLDLSNLKMWKEVHNVKLTNIFFDGKLPNFLGFDYGPVYIQGSRATVVQGAVYQAHGRTTTFCPSWRFIADLSKDSALTVLAGGPSDRRYGPHYLNDLEKWINFEYKELNLID
ncbi:MAG: penicillin acylase family protein [Bacteriovoracaceae bacterium]|nr:penicillin acylase family protein [Bacteriovoracaceae bacterium]